MPKIIFPYEIVIHGEQPQCCRDCPLLGKRPATELSKGDRQTHVCLAFIYERDPKRKTISGRMTKAKRDDPTKNRAKNKLHRLCDRYWDKWVNGNRKGHFNFTEEVYWTYRKPMTDTLQLELFKNQKS